MVVCKCLFLDGKEVDVTIDREASGDDLFQSVCKYQNISEPNYFGLVLRQGSNPPPYNWWVRLDKPLKKQIQGKCKIWSFAFVLKFYPQSKHFNFGNESTRFNTIYQLRQDLLTNRLRCPTSTRALLAAYWLQSEYGDYVSKNVDFQLVEAFRFVQRGKSPRLQESDINFEEQMVELHQCLRGMTSSKSDKKFLLLAASLQNYGIHFYPAYKLKNQSNKHMQRTHECGPGIMFGIGPKGITLLQDRKPVMTYKWNDVRAIAFKHNAITVKLNETDKKSPDSMTYVFDDDKHAKNVWKTSIDFHVHFRIEAKNLKVKLKRNKTSKKVKAFSKTATPTISHPQLSSIAESPNHNERRSHVSTPGRSHQDTPARSHVSSPARSRVDAPGEETHPKLVDETPKTPRRPPRSNPSAPGSPASRISKNSPRAPTSVEHISRGTSPDGAARNSSPSTTVRYEDQPPRSVTSIVSLSDVTDDTEVLCSKKMVDRAFQFPEEDGITSVTSWLRNNESRGRTKSRSAPGSHRASSRGRSQFNDSDADDINDYKPLIPSRRPVVIRAKDLRDLSPPLTVHYEDEPVRRAPVRPDRYKSAENIRRTWSRESSPAGALQRRYHDIYRRELMNNLSQMDPYRRSKSLHSLGPRRQSYYCDHCMTLTPSTVSANASSGSQRSMDFLEIEDNRLPVESSFTKRVLSESRLARNQPRSSRQDRNHVTSWTGGDCGYLTQSFKETKPVRRFKDSIPEMPKFIRSVR